MDTRGAISNIKNLVKRRISATGQEAVELQRYEMTAQNYNGGPSDLDKEEQIRILALGCGPVTFLDVMVCNVDTLETRTSVHACVATVNDSELTILVLAGLCV